MSMPGVAQGQVVQTLSPIHAPLPPDTTAPGLDENPND
jgi:hypothetical protein